MTLAKERISELDSHLMLFYTGITRTAADIAGTYVQNLSTKRQQLRLLGDMVNEAIDILSSGRDLAPFGELLHEAWQVKSSLGAQISNSQVNDIYEEALAAGALGGKLTGAGGGGFLLLFVPLDRQQQVRDALPHLLHVPFKFDFTGSQIIFVDRQEDYSAEETARASQSVRPFQEYSRNAET
jgi:D-glycero-alpha-D-manno-heptose-7-phosphate kinase